MTMHKHAHGGVQEDVVEDKDRISCCHGQNCSLLPSQACHSNDTHCAYFRETQRDPILVEAGPRTNNNNDQHRKPEIITISTPA